MLILKNTKTPTLFLNIDSNSSNSDQPGRGNLILAETVNRTSFVNGDQFCMGMGNGGGVIEVYDKMAVGCNLVNQLIQRTVLNDLTLVDDNNPLAQLLDIAQVVGGQDNGGLTTLIDFLKETLI